MSAGHHEDRLEIEQLLYRYAWMADEREWTLMDTVFSSDATIDYTSTGGKRGHYRSTLEWLDRALAAWPINLHFITNIHIEFENAQTARSRCYFLAPMGRQKDAQSQEVITNAGYYFDALVKESGAWRIRERVCRQTTMIGQLPAGYVIPD